jgi:photosystem II stability/assembly factor-like uncharacterized protein
MEVNMKKSILFFYSIFLYGNLCFGKDWDSLNPNTVDPNYELKYVTFISEDVGWAVGYNIILKATDGGTTWMPQFKGTPLFPIWLYGISFTDENNGAAVGEQGTILRTTNGGEIWNKQNSSTDKWLCGVCFIDENNGIAVGEGGTILRTTNGGIAWNLPSIQTSAYLEYLRRACFSNGNYTIVGDDGIILKSTDGGKNWFQQTSGTISTLYDVYYSDDKNGIIIGGISNPDFSNQGIILKTTNGGETWETKSNEETPLLLGFDFIDKDNGIAVGAHEVILRTTNGGINWVEQFLGPENYDLDGVSFNSINNIVAVGDLGSLFTTDGGKNWIRQSWTFIDEDNNSSGHNNFLLRQNYPNPFNPSTNIEFRIAEFGFVSLKVYDILGREVATLVNEEKHAGNYEVKFNGSGLSSGIYFFKLSTEDYTSVKKMLLIK